MTSRPRKVRVSGKTLSIDYVGAVDLPKDLNGNVDHDDLRIKVVLGLPLESEQDTVLHEIMHAIDDSVCAGMREVQVRRMATAMLAFMKENPRVISYLRRSK